MMSVLTAPGATDTQFVSDAIANVIKDKQHPDNISVKEHHHRSKVLDKINKISPRINKAQLFQMTIQEQMTKYGLDYDEVTQLRRTLLGLGDKKPIEITGEVEIPDVIGMSIEKASNFLRKAQLSIGESTYQDDIKPKGMVISQDPEARTKVQVHSDIYLVLSSGISFRIPNIVGRTLEYALTTLRENGLKSEPVIVLSPTEKHSRNTILKVTPTVGTTIVPDTVITLEVSSGQDKHQRGSSK